MMIFFKRDIFKNVTFVTSQKFNFQDGRMLRMITKAYEMC